MICVVKLRELLRQGWNRGLKEVRFFGEYVSVAETEQMKFNSVSVSFGQHLCSCRKSLGNRKVK